MQANVHFRDNHRQFIEKTLLCYHCSNQNIGDKVIQIPKSEADRRLENAQEEITPIYSMVIKLPMVGLAQLELLDRGCPHGAKSAAVPAQRQLTAWIRIALHCTNTQYVMTAVSGKSLLVYLPIAC